MINDILNFYLYLSLWK